MQKIYSFIFNTIYKFNSKVSERIRDVALVLCCAFLVWLYYFSPLSLDGGNIEVMGSIAVALIIIFSINKEMGSIEWNKWVLYPMILFGIGMLMIGSIHPVGDGFVMYALDLIFLFPALYFVWNNRGDHEKLYSIMSTVLLMAGVISFIYCIILAGQGNLAMSGSRVSGHTINPNYLGMMGIGVLISSLYLVSISKSKLLIVTAASIGIGIGITYVIISVSRTSMIAALICVITFAVFLLKRRQGYKTRMKKDCVIILIAIISITAIFTVGIHLNDINSSAAEKRGILIESSASQGQPSEAKSVSDRVDAGGKSADSFSSGRLSIWKVYAENIKWLGSPLSDIKEELQTTAETRAHNNFLEYYYRCGYIVDTLYLLFFTATGISGLALLIKKRYRSPEEAFAVMIIGTYSVFAMLEIAMLPFIRLIPCLFFLSISPIVKKHKTIDAIP